MRKLLAVVCLIVSAGVLCAQENLWPDFEFNTLGVKNNAHSGEYAGEFSVSGPTRWQGYCARKINVEPYAVYRATAWCKLEPGMQGGVVRALYSYGWYTFGWNFMFNVALQDSPDWQKVSCTFYVPDEQVDFLPLVIEGSNKAKAWIDELEIVKIKSGEEHIAELKKRGALNDAERRLLARYYLRGNDMTALKKLYEEADPVTRADIDCLRLDGKIEPQNAVSQLASIMYQAAGTPDGAKQITKHLAGFSTKDQAAAMLEAFQLGKANSNCMKSWPLFMAAQGRPGEMRLAKLKTIEAEQAEADVLFKAAHDQKILPDELLAQWQLHRKAWQVEYSRQNGGKRTIILEGVAVTSDTHAIVLPGEPTPSEKRAADELALFWEKMTGQDLSIVSENEPVNKIPLLVGRSAKLKEHGFSVDYGKLALEGIHLESSPKTHALLLAGGQRGVLYAVYTFLEEYLGCRWFTDDCSVIPQAEEKVVLPHIQKEFIPVLEQRDANFTCCHHVKTSVRNKLNGAAVPADASWGGHISYRGFVHTFEALVPPSVYGATHPEYYSEIKGKRQVQNSQLCLTNPEVIKIATESVRRWIKESPDATIISVSQNDRRNYCECSKCTAMAEAEGSQAGPLLYFVNAIAKEIGKEHPEKIIDTLAYQYTRKPPKNIKPLPNVAIRLCSIECCFTHPLGEDPFNKTFVDDIIGWSKICNRLHIWDYVINYAHNVMPFPNFRVLKPNIKFFIEHHVTSIFEEANYYSDASELAELRSYVMFKLLWNPDYDTDKAIREFTDAYYGAAAPFIRGYLNVLHDAVCNQPDLHVRIYSPASHYLKDQKLLDTCEALFQLAMAEVKDNPTELHRVQVAYLPLIYTRQMLKTRGMKLVDGVLTSQNAVAMAKELDFFEDVAAKANLQRISESQQGTTVNWLAKCRAALKSYPVVSLKKDSLRMDILPSCGGRIWRAQMDGRDIFRVVGNEQDGYLPDTDGYEEYASADFRKLGFKENFAVAKKGDDFVEMSAILADGVIVNRRIELLAIGKNPAFKVTTRYTSKTPMPARACRVHPVFNIPEPQKAILMTMREGGIGIYRFSELLEMPDKPDYERYFKNDDKPMGEWVLDFLTEDNRECSIINRFNSDDVDFCYLHLYRPEHRINLEMWSKAVPLSPTTGPVLSNTYMISPGWLED